MSDQDRINFLCNLIGIGSLDFDCFIEKAKDLDIDIEDYLDYIEEPFKSAMASPSGHPFDLNGYLADYVLYQLIDGRFNNTFHPDDFGYLVSEHRDCLPIIMESIRDTVEIYANYLDTQFLFDNSKFYNTFVGSLDVDDVDDRDDLYKAEIGKIVQHCNENEEFAKTLEFIGVKDFLFDEHERLR